MDDVNFFSPEVALDPYPTYKILRDRIPAYQDPRTSMWLFTRFDDVYGTLGDHETYSSQGTNVAIQRVSALYFTLPPDYEVPAPSPMFNDAPPRHSYLRRIVNKPLTRHQI